MTDTTDATAGTPAPTKPGWQTSEFYLKHLAILLSVLIATDVIPVGGLTMQIVMIAAMWLTAEGYTVSRTIVKAVGGMLLVAFLLHTTTACGASQRETTLKVAVGSVDVAESTLHAYDMRHQVELVEQAPDQAAARVSVDAWRATRDKFDRDITAAYRALLAASLLNDDPSLTGALAAAAVVTTELRTLKVLP